MPCAMRCEELAQYSYAVGVRYVITSSMSGEGTPDVRLPTADAPRAIAPPRCPGTRCRRQRSLRSRSKAASRSNVGTSPRSTTRITLCPSQGPRACRIVTPACCIVTSACCIVTSAAARTAPRTLPLSPNLCLGSGVCHLSQLGVSSGEIVAAPGAGRAAPTRSQLVSSALPIAPERVPIGFVSAASGGTRAAARRRT